MTRSVFLALFCCSVGCSRVVESPSHIDYESEEKIEWDNIYISNNVVYTQHNGYYHAGTLKNSSVSEQTNTDNLDYASINVSVPLSWYGTTDIVMSGVSYYSSGFQNRDSEEKMLFWSTNLYSTNISDIILTTKHTILTSFR